MNGWETYLIPSAWFLACLAAGILLEKYLLPTLSRPVLKSRWKLDDILLSSLRGMALLWSVVTGCYVFLKSTAQGVENSGLARKVFFALLALSIAVVISRILVGFIRYKAKSAGLYRSTTIVTNIVRIAIYIIFGLIVRCGSPSLTFADQALMDNGNGVPTLPTYPVEWADAE